MSRSDSLGTGDAIGFPRSRGDEPGIGMCWIVIEAFSPLTRG